VVLNKSTPEAKSDRIKISKEILARAITLGANGVGISPAIIPGPDTGGFREYQEWVSSGKHGEMAYMSRVPESRKDITRWFAPARSVVVCAFSYHDGAPTADLGPDQGRLARYCLPPDYHDILKERMTRLLDYCRQIRPGCSGKVFVDTSPVMERLYARHAGIGWVGKNSMLIAPDAGSFLLLAGLALDLELEYDSPLPDRCGKCERCLKACPTQALVKPRVLDATRCIAYTTVELRRGGIPEPLRASHGGWIFGCDACQEVCPWNRFAERNRKARHRGASRAPYPLGAKPGGTLVPRMASSQTLSDLAGLTSETFSKRFKGTPIKRTGYTAFLRNVLLAMGVSGDSRHRTALERFSRHPDPVLSEQARWSLARLESDRIRE